MRLSSKQIADLTGVSTRTLRYYHQIGLLPEPDRRSNNYRVYEPQHVVRMLRIKRLRMLGMSLEQIAIVLDAPSSSDAYEILADLEGALTTEIERLGEQKRLVARMRHEGGPIDVLPEFAGHIEALTERGESDRDLGLLKAVIEVIAGVGAAGEVAAVAQVLEMDVDATAANMLRELDARFERVGSQTPTEEIETLAWDYARMALALTDDDGDASGEKTATGVDDLGVGADDLGVGTDRESSGRGSARRGVERRGSGDSVAVGRNTVGAVKAWPREAEALTTQRDVDLATTGQRNNARGLEQSPAEVNELLLGIVERELNPQQQKVLGRALQLFELGSAAI